MDRRHFIKNSLLLTGSVFFNLNNLLPESGIPELVLVKNGNPEQMTIKAIELLGGIKRFINKRDVVFIKPNMSWDRSVEYAANTHPLIVKAVIEACFSAGAKKVIVADRTCQEARRCYKNSGIQEVTKKAGATVLFVRENQFVSVSIPEGEVLKSWEFYRPALEADKYINIPILKHHNLAGLTIGFKNIMGILGGNRGRIHRDFNRKIVDLNRVIKPTLTIIDATRILTAHGPSGGNLKDVIKAQTIIAGTDRVLTEAWAIRIFGADPSDFPLIKLAHSAGMGKSDTKKHKPLTYTFQK